MTTSTRRILTTGLSIVSTLGLAMSVQAWPEDPSPADPPIGAAPAVREEFLLLTDGRLIQGVISREGSVYVLKKKIGVMRFPKKLVEGAYGSLREAYQHKLAQLPEEDPAERLKLARWCMSNNLTAEAKAQLMKVLDLSPDHGPAQAMLSKLELSDTSPTGRIDPEIRQTAAEEVAEDKPGALDSAVLRGAERGMGISRLPVIFDLPRPLAIRRADEFARFIHPVLQLKCAKCHNAGYEGPFQLVPVANSRQLTQDALRANLDATLRLIDPENPSKSELLSSTLRPHGSGPRKRPIFEGSNNRFYQILAFWVNNLSPQSSRVDSAVKPASGRSDGDSERFAADRSRPGGASLEAAMPGLAPSPGRGMKPDTFDPKMNPAFRFKPGQGWESEDLMKADPAEFPIPYMLGGPKPTSSTKTTIPKPRSAASQSALKSSMSGLTATTKGKAASGTVEADKAESENAGDMLPAPTDSVAKKTRKPAKIDPAILEKLLQRNADRSPGQ
ncbi:MAG: hypothetical protein ACLQGP_20590 [Isosphaeraceae bacterium]